MEDFTVRTIGYVKNTAQDVGFNDWATLVSGIVVHETYSEALDGIEQFSHLL